MGCSFAFRTCFTFLLIAAACGGSARATVITTGDVTPGGSGLQPDPWEISGKLKIGEFSSGTLSVQGGGTVLNGDTGTIGHYLGATGVATVTGTDSTWDNDQNLIVGLSGSAVLNVTNGGKLHNKSYASAGYYTNATGEITISGTDSSWDNRGALYLGTRGSGTLNVEAGGMVSNSSDGYLGQLPGSSGLATVTGEGSQWDSGDDLWIGGKESEVGGTGILNIYNGGLVTVPDMTRLWDTGTLNLDGGTLTTGSFDNSEDGTLNFHDGVFHVNGPGGSFTPGTNSFGIDGDGADDFPELLISNTAGLAVPGDLQIGVNERGRLKVASGGVVASSYGYLGYNNSSTGEVTISGADSKWENSAYLYVGDSSSGTLKIEDGGTLENGEVSSIGYLSSATGVVTVTGTDSRWNNTGTLNVGDSGTGTLNITDGGMVSSPVINFIGLDAGSTGQATVRDTGSQWVTPKLYIGERGNGALNVAAGGVVTNDIVFIGTYPGGTGTATVAGANSKWTSSNLLNVGWSGSGSLHIEDGGFVSTGDSYLATNSDGTAEATVTGTGSNWNHTGDLNLGVRGPATLNVTDGGLVSNADGYIGYHTDGTGVATVTGIGSSWNHTNNFYAGYNGTGTLNITAGGVVSNVDGYIGYHTDGTGTVTVGGIGSTWNNSNNLYVGRDGTGTLNVADGGLVTVGNTTSIGTSATVNLTGGRFEFGETTLEEFSTITGSSGSMAGNLRHAGYTEASTLTALQNSAVDLTEVTLTNSGVLYGTAAMGTALINTLSGEVEVMPAERLRFAGSANTNTGEINNFGGQIRFEQDLTNLPDGIIEGRGQFVANGGWINSGVMFFTGTTDILGDVVNEKNGQIVSSGSGTTTFYDDLDHNGLEIRTSKGGKTIIGGAATGAGAYTGDGDVYFEGDLRPGNSPGIVRFDGNVVLGSTSTTQIELGGLIPGEEFDQLLVDGELILNGQLMVELIDGYVPSEGDRFHVFDFGLLAGDFQQLHLPLLSDNLLWNTTGLTVDGILAVESAITGLGGDFNADGFVDAADYTIWRDGDSPDSTAAGYILWADNFGQSSASSSGANPVPESTTLLLALLAFVAAPLRVRCG